MKHPSGLMIDHDAEHQNPFAGASLVRIRNSHSQCRGFPAPAPLHPLVDPIPVAQMDPTRSFCPAALQFVPREARQVFHSRKKTSPVPPLCSEDASASITATGSMRRRIMTKGSAV